MNVLWLIVILLIVIALVGAPGIGFTHSYGYYPSGAVTLIIIILVILLLTGRL